jgi:NTP pyrophosphatase (non-canonical NTP hydrolase)
MQPSDYQRQAARTLIDSPDKEYTPEEIMLVWNAMGLAGEAGEIANSVKKMVFHQHGIDRIALVKELGDVLWYIAAICTKLGVEMQDAMDLNIAKLQVRFPDGYSSAASKARVDVEGN